MRSKLTFGKARKGRGNGVLGRCWICGVDKTTKGTPLTGYYCSPACHDRAKARPDSHGLGELGHHDLRLSDEKDWK